MSIINRAALWLGFVPKLDLDKCVADADAMRVAIEVQKGRANYLEKQLNIKIADMAASVSSLVQVYERDFSGRYTRNTLAIVTEIDYSLLCQITRDLRIDSGSVEYERLCNGLFYDTRRKFDSFMDIL